MQRFKNILCVLDHKATASTVLQQVKTLIQTNQATVTLMSVIDKPAAGFALMQKPDVLRALMEQVQARRRNDLETWREAYLPDEDADIVVEEGTRFLRLIQKVLRDGHDLVVKCSDANEWDTHRPSSDDMHLLRKCPCPVLLLRPEAKTPFMQIMATVDVADSDEDLRDSGRVQRELNRCVLDYAVLMAVSEDATLHVASVWDAYGENFLRYGIFSQTPDTQIADYVEQSRRECAHRLDGLLDDLRDRVGDETMAYLDPQAHLVKGLPYEQIVRLVAEQRADLLVMGTVARTGIPGFIIGNTAEAILTRAPCSVLAVKPEGFVSPVTLPASDTL